MRGEHGIERRGKEREKKGGRENRKGSRITKEIEGRDERDAWERRRGKKRRRRVIEKKKKEVERKRGKG